ncbi:AraC family transcriptional regulator [Eubacterium sp. am_0171]|nr:AraC family transcriptional regulator [Eubacterium sp. am_0171]MSC84881.1 AraC family transcriptional regulator [Eubacterium sp. BIOML-A1]MSD07169.1 AraC family transcriptional regulator [Eubacterium sp. BIOML-A2]RYT16095.1 AraC family transcriptional regulator [Eubacterium sp. am_0171]
MAEELGYSDAGTFRHIFKKYYGMPPIDYRDRFLYL